MGQPTDWTGSSTYTWSHVRKRGHEKVEELQRETLHWWGRCRAG